MTDDNLNRECAKLLGCKPWETKCAWEIWVDCPKEMIALRGPSALLLGIGIVEMRFHKSLDWVQLLIEECSKRELLDHLYSKIQDSMDLDGEFLDERAELLLTPAKQIALCCLEVLK